MPIKHQSQCYRIFKGIRYKNFCDLIMSDEENEKMVIQAKNEYVYVRQIKHPDGYNQLFVSRKKLYRANIIELGRSKHNADIFFNTTAELHKYIGKHLRSKHWGMEETDMPDTWDITSGHRSVGTVVITEVKALNQP